MAENDGTTEEYEVEGQGTMMLNQADAEAYGDRAKKVSASKAGPDPTVAQQEAEEAERLRQVGEQAATEAAAKVRTEAANKAVKSAANKSA
jgi:hypothetical protein